MLTCPNRKNPKNRATLFWNMDITDMTRQSIHIPYVPMHKYKFVSSAIHNSNTGQDLCLPTKNTSLAIEEEFGYIFSEPAKTPMKTNIQNFKIFMV